MNSKQNELKETHSKTHFSQINKSQRQKIGTQYTTDSQLDYQQISQQKLHRPESSRKYIQSTSWKNKNKKQNKRAVNQDSCIWQNCPSTVWGKLKHSSKIKAEGVHYN